MKATLTLKIKLETTAQAAQSLSETQKAYVIALNYTSEVESSPVGGHRDNNSSGEMAGQTGPPQLSERSR